METDLIKLPRNREAIVALFIEMKKRIEYLEEENRILKQRLFGRKSEKTAIADGQGYLFAVESPEMEMINRIGELSEETVTVVSHPRTKKKWKILGPDTPVTEVIEDIPEEDKQCGCGARMVAIGRETHFKVEYEPEKLRVERHVRPKYACKACEGSGDEGRPAVRIAPAPPQIIPKSIVTASLLSFVLTMKFEYAMPFYRLSKKFARQGIEISRADMSNWAVRAGLALDRLIDLMWSEILSGSAMLIDETTLLVMNEPGRDNKSKSFIWAFRGGTIDAPIIVFKYHPSRSGKVPYELLEKYVGFVQTDGYSGYDLLHAILTIVHVGDWTHVRRKFVDALKAGSGKGQAEYACEVIGSFFHIENVTRERYPDLDTFVAERKRLVLPEFDKLKTWLVERVDKVPPQSLLGKAINYTLKEWPKLVRYVDCPLLTPSTNMIENTIRPIVVGRKNFLFGGSPDGARAIANIYSLSETAKAYGLDPFQYFCFVFEKLPLAETEDDLRRLLPKYFARKPK
jgi:transposase